MKYITLFFLLTIVLSANAQTTTKLKPKAPTKKKKVEETPPPTIEELIIMTKDAYRSGRIVEDTVTYYGSVEGLDSIARFQGADFGMLEAGKKSHRLSNFVKAVAKKELEGTCPGGSFLFRITVDTKGMVANVISVNLDPNSECARLIIDAIYQSSGRWTPAVKNGQKVKNKFLFSMEKY